MPHGNSVMSADLRPFSASSLIRLPDQISFRNGHIDMLARFVLLADRLARDLGVRLSISRDFDELLAVNVGNRATWEPLFPVVDPRFHAIDPEAGFWLRGIDADGAVVLTRACRRIDLGASTLQEELTSLRLLYAPGSSGESPDELLYCDCPSASAVTGAISFQAGGWHRPDYRGKGLSAIASRLVKVIGLAEWGVGQWISLVDDVLAPGLCRSYGVSQAEAGIHWQRFGEQHRMYLFRMTADDLLADLPTFMQRHAGQPVEAAP